MGSNAGSPWLSLRAALVRLAGVLDGLHWSAVYRSAPVGYARQPDFLNLVCAGTTLLGPEALLAQTRAIEHSLGRTRTFPNAPRTLDIDILACGDRVVNAPNLILPHPRMHQRAFVLVPLAEIAPDWHHPVLGRTAGELLAEGGPFERIEQVGRIPEF